MGFIDLIRELRTGEADPGKAAAGMKFLGWLCLFGGVWNFVLPKVAPLKEAGFRLPEDFPYLALLAFSTVGVLSVFSALEVRLMFHRFLVPYEKMEDLPEKIGFFTAGLLIRSDLPGVPSRIRFSGFGMKKILQVVNDARADYRPTFAD